MCQEVSLNGTLRPGVEDSERHFDRIKSWPGGGYVREASFSSELGCPGVSSLQLGHVHIAEPWYQKWDWWGGSGGEG